MEAITKEILNEKGKTYPDTHYIQRLQRLMDKRRIELDDFITTARTIDREDFEQEYFMVRLQKECNHVIMFMCGHYIQVLGTPPSEAYYYNTLYDGIEVEIIDKDFGKVVSQLYNLRVDDVINLWKKDY
jgi:hypothetical protein